jgi:hypothetical protein
MRLLALVLLSLPLSAQAAKQANDRYQTGAMPNNNALTHIRLNKPDVIKEIEANHFRLISERDQIKDSQYMLILDRN